MSTAVIYARIPEALKETVEGYAKEQGATLTTAVVDLLERGLEAVSNVASVAELQERATQLSEKLRNADFKVRTLEERERTWLPAYRAIAEKPVGSCPQCQATLHGYDLLVGGQCPKCQRELASLLTAAASAGSGFDGAALLILIGALGLLVGMALKNKE